MSDIKKCPSCLGKKEHIGLGMIKKTCKICSGIGYIKSDEQNTRGVILSNKTPPPEPVNLETSIKRKRGRPKKDETRA